MGVKLWISHQGKNIDRGCLREEVARGWRRPHKYYAVIKSRRMRLVGYVAPRGEMRCIQNVCRKTWR